MQCRINSTNSCVTHLEFWVLHLFKMWFKFFFFKRKEKSIWQHPNDIGVLFIRRWEILNCVFLSVIKYCYMKKEKKNYCEDPKCFQMQIEESILYGVNGGPVYLWRAINDIYSNTSLIVCTKHHGNVRGRGFGVLGWKTLHTICQKAEEFYYRKTYTQKINFCACGKNIFPHKIITPKFCSHLHRVPFPALHCAGSI